jgi:hypothetical protein
MARYALLLLTAVVLMPLGQASAQTRSPDERIREAIEANQATPEVTGIAKDKLRRLARHFRSLGGEIAARHLEHFLSGSGTDIHYRLGDPVSETVKTFDEAEFSHNAAHQYALKRILAYFQGEIRSGRQDFPAYINLSDIGFTATGPDRLQGPNVYEKGALFRVPVFPPYKLDMAAGFGDFQGPHEGVIRNIKVVEGTPGQAEGKKTLTFEVLYKWNDVYTFNNDQNMSDWDRAAHYLEFIAKEAKSFKTSVIANSNVSAEVDSRTENEGDNDPKDGGTSDPKDGGTSDPKDGGPPNNTDTKRYQGTLKVPKNVPGWVTGKIKNIDDVPYDIDGGSSSNPATNPGKNSDDVFPNPSKPRPLGSQATPEKLKDLSAWRELLSFRPATQTQSSVHSTGDSWTVHRVEDGSNDVNLDYYPVVVEKLPVVNGKEIRAELVLEYVRRNLNKFVDHSLTAFAPFHAEDEKKWNSRQPLNSILQIDIELLLPIGGANVPLGATDLAMVVASRHTPQEWIFSTVRGGSGWWAINDRERPGAHPVSGNRAFGFRRNGNGSYTFYTMGADRASRGMDVLGSPVGFRMADRLWRSYQQSVVEFINRYGGVARVDYENTISKRHDWDEVKDDPTIYDPTGQPEWIPVPRN